MTGLDETFARARARSAQLPPHARPVVTRPPTRALDPAGDAPLTVRQHPHDGRTDPNARRAIRTPDGQWLAISGPRAGWELTDADVVGWPIPHPAWWSPSLADDLAHLQSLARSETAR